MYARLTLAPSRAEGQTANSGLWSCAFLGGLYQAILANHPSANPRRRAASR